MRTVLAVSAALALLLPVAPARAASLQKVAPGDWTVSGLPTYVTMYIYVPDRLATKPPIVVAPHHCGGTGPGTFNEMQSLVSIANGSGFIMIFPEATGENCWDAGSTRSLKHDGGGDTQAIVEMVRHTLSKYGGDASRVYTVGSSSGGIMTEALLGVYPDVFRAGVSLMGVPCGCWAQNYNDVTGSGNTAQWSGPCASGSVTKTGQQWADLVRSYFPGYSGHRPRLQHWHGTADTTLNYKNMAESTKEWTTLLGLSDTPNGTDTPKSGTTHQFWKNTCGFTVYETFSLAGVGHAVPFDGNAVAAYFGLDKAGPDPEVDCGGTGGMSGAGGNLGTGGASNGGSGGASSGAGGANGGGGGVASTGGAFGSGGTRATGAAGSSGGASVGATGGTTAAAGSGGSAGGAATIIPAASGGSAALGNDTGGAGAGLAAPSTSTESSSSCALGARSRHTGSMRSMLVLALASMLRRRRSSRATDLLTPKTQL